MADVQLPMLFANISGSFGSQSAPSYGVSLIATVFGWLISQQSETGQVCNIFMFKHVLLVKLDDYLDYSNKRLTIGYLEDGIKLLIPPFITILAKRNPYQWGPTTYFSNVLYCM